MQNKTQPSPRVTWCWRCCSSRWRWCPCPASPRCSPPSSPQQSSGPPEGRATPIYFLFKNYRERSSRYRYQPLLRPQKTQHRPLRRPLGTVFSATGRDWGPRPRGRARRPPRCLCSWRPRPRPHCSSIALALGSRIPGTVTWLGSGAAGGVSTTRARLGLVALTLSKLLCRVCSNVARQNLIDLSKRLIRALIQGEDRN